MMVRITAACPEDLCADANHLAMVLGMGPDDAATYDDCNWQDDDGARFSVISFEAPLEWLSRAQIALARPSWDLDRVVDLEAARRAQEALDVWTSSRGAPVTAPMGSLSVVVGPNPTQAIADLGLSPVIKDAVQ